jgi:hypothetical protein
MVTSRTGTASHLRFRKAVLTRDRKAGITHCPECGVLMDYDTSRQPHSAEPDHITAHKYGGTNDPTNGRTICRACNQSLGDKRRPQTATQRPLRPSPDW